MDAPCFRWDEVPESHPKSGTLLSTTLPPPSQSRAHTCDPNTAVHAHAQHISTCVNTIPKQVTCVLILLKSSSSLSPDHASHLFSATSYTRSFRTLRQSPVSVSSLSRWWVQVSPVALNTSENILMCAPTGAGKTNVAMLSILHTVSLFRRKDGSVRTSDFKIIYVAPMKVGIQESSCTAYAASEMLDRVQHTRDACPEAEAASWHCMHWSLIKTIESCLDRLTGPVLELAICSLTPLMMSSFGCDAGTCG